MTLKFEQTKRVSLNLMKNQSKGVSGSVDFGVEERFWNAEIFIWTKLSEMGGSKFLIFIGLRVRTYISLKIADFLLNFPVLEGMIAKLSVD